ncbi:LAMI_0F01904g1_1 [Lachancea mirantina]|uniref:Post-GPI attachment to proteins factor 3 n=1 Tax=Lachancea mirantina TaxID=1230905 RepID=A0A1G4JWC7_9SACH|nr:LAMI_0F01904g1_1 [Lachancea mirantina]
MRCLLAILLILSGLGPAMASPGDWLDEFIECNEECTAIRQCFGPNESGFLTSHKSSNFKRTPFLLRHFLLWDCASDCDYQCQQIVTKERIASGKKIEQFHGKWPFKRVLGTQEFFSTVFSVGNFIPHYRGLKLLAAERKRTPAWNKARVLLTSYMSVAVVGMLAWTASTVFHTRDVDITEKCDYFFAGATVLSGFHAISIRVFRLDCLDGVRRIFSYSVGALFALHILRLLLDWSYTYNMRFNIFFGVLQYLLLIALAYRNYTKLKTLSYSRKPRYASKSSLLNRLCLVPVGLVIGTSLAMSFELFDIFNYDLQIDSHSIWHACTVLPSWKLYDFFVDDIVHLKACESDNMNAE